MKRFTDEQGFTLIEVLIAVVIFTVGILSVNVMQLTSIKGNSTANNISEATRWGVDKMEQFLAMDYNNATLFDDNDGGIYMLADGTTGTADGSTPSLDGSYNIFWNVTNNSPINNTKTIEVIVTWVRGKPKSYTITFIKSNIY
ncbi:MAG: prepilin-type N-terminal cleavage/methylation domain-containing protein [Candidatus Brocadiales bacterium]|nr:prepilin-type N-terminal cleavage/methylation domain-containing protein [Candidatus Brocadiales bacterium]